MEIDQPGASIFLDGNPLDVNVPGKMQPIKLPVQEGWHELKVVKSGFRSQTREFNYRKGKAKPIVQVRLVPLKKQ